MKQSPSTGESLVLPPLVSFSSATDLLAALTSLTALSTHELETFRRLAKANLPPLISPTCFGLILGVSPKLISAISIFPRRHYRAFDVQKRTGGKRRILAPRTYLKVLQRFILRRILERQPLPKYVTGFVKSRSTVQNASAHVGSRYFLNIDLKDFFGSVRGKQVLRIFRRIGYPAGMAEALTRLCTYRDCLPQGAPTSPYLANLAFLPTDLVIARVCDRLKIVYSRYADDLTFSRKKPLPEMFLNDIERIILRHGFELNGKKTRNSRPGQASYVTGFVVTNKVQPDRKNRRILRAMFHNALSHPERFGSRKSELQGWASYVNAYDSELGGKYMDIAASISDG